MLIDLNPLNEYGVPLHACNGYKQDEHYWAWLKYKKETGVGPYYDWLRKLAAESESKGLKEQI